MDVDQQVARLRQNVGRAEGVEAKLDWDPGVFEAEHTSMEVSPRWNSQEGWFRKDVVQATEAWAEFSPYLVSVCMCGPFEQRGVEVRGPCSGPTPAATVVIFAYGGGR